MEIARTFPTQLVRAPATFGLYQRITVTNVAATLVSLLSGGVLPTIPVPNNPNLKYSFKFVDLQAETDPSVVVVRYTADGQTAPTSTLGFVVAAGASMTRIPCDPQDIKLISAGADVKVQVYLGIMGTADGAVN